MDFDTLLNRGLRKLEDNEYDEAIQFFEKALRLNSEHPELYYYLGDAYSKKGDKQAATDYYTQSARVRHVLIQKGVDLANAMASMKEQGHRAPAHAPVREPEFESPVYPAPQHKVKKVVQNKQLAEDYYRLGVEWVKTGNLNSALEYLEKAVGIKPDYPDAFFAMGMIYDEQGELKDAISAYEAVIELQPRNTLSHYNLALAYLKTGKADKALNQYTNLCEMDKVLAEKLFEQLSES